MQLLRQLAERVGIRRLDVLVVGFNRRPYTIPQDRQLQPGWVNMRQFTKIDHPDPQAKILIDNKLIDSVSVQQTTGLYSDMSGSVASLLCAINWPEGCNLNPHVMKCTAQPGGH